MSTDSGGTSPPNNVPMTIDNSINYTNKIKFQYQMNDYGPYNVFVQASETSGKNIGNYNHLGIAKEIFNLNLKDIKKIEKKGRNRLSVEFKNYTAANKFVDNKTLIEKGYTMFIPANLVSCKGVVRNVDKNLTDDELLQFSKIIGRNIIQIKRLNRKSRNEDGEIIYIPTGTILFTISGKLLPKTVEICYLSLPIVPYKFPVIQCQNCFRFGHITKQCRGKKKCAKCSKTHEDTCEFSQKCINCSSDSHSATDRKCPEFLRQLAIKEKMAFENKSYFDANKDIPKTYNQPINSTMTEIRHPNDFPPLNNNYTDISEQEYTSQTHNPIGNYSLTVQSKKKRKIYEGYDKEAHSSCLITPLTRTKTQSTPTIINSPSDTIYSENTDMNIISDLLNNMTNEQIRQVITFINHISQEKTKYTDRDLVNYANVDTPQQEQQ